MNWYCEFDGDSFTAVGAGGKSDTFDSFFAFASDPTELKPYISFSLNVPQLLQNPPTAPINEITVSMEILGQAGLDRLSIPGFPFPPVWISILGHEISKFPANPLPGPGMGKYDCRPLSRRILDIANPTEQVLWPGVTPTPLENWINGYAPTVWPLPAGVYPALLNSAGIRHYHQGAVPNLYSMMYFLSRRLALGHILSRAKIARDVVTELSSSLGATISTTVVNDAYKLIKRAIGVEPYDLESAIGSNIQDLVDYSSGAFMRMQEEVMRAQASAGP